MAAVSLEPIGRRVQINLDSAREAVAILGRGANTKGGEVENQRDRKLGVLRKYVEVNFLDHSRLEWLCKWWIKLQHFIYFGLNCCLMTFLHILHPLEEGKTETAMSQTTLFSFFVPWVICFAFCVVKANDKHSSCK